MNTVAEELAHVRALAEAGRRTPLVGGGYLVFFGVLNAAAYLAQWTLLSGTIDAPGWSFGALWGGYGLVAGAGMALLSRRVRTMPGVQALANRIDHAAWRGAAFGIWAVVAGCILHAILNRDPTATDFIAVGMFALAGAALHVTAKTTERPWLTGFAIVAFSLAALLGASLGAWWFYLAASAGSALALAAPGAVLLARQPRAAAA